MNEIIPILLSTRRKIMEEPELPGAVSGSDEQDIGESETGPGQSNAPVGSEGRRASAAQHFDDLQSLKIETMRGMAKTVKYSRGESICTCKVAYFTTKQLLNMSLRRRCLNFGKPWIFKSPNLLSEFFLACVAEVIGTASQKGIQRIPPILLQS